MGPIPLTRISHTPSATKTYLPASTALCSIGLLDVVFQYASGALGRMPCIRRHLRRFATKLYEKCGLALLVDVTGYDLPVGLGHVFEENRDMVVEDVGILLVGIHANSYAVNLYDFIVNAALYHQRHDQTEMQPLKGRNILVNMAENARTGDVPGPNNYRLVAFGVSNDLGRQCGWNPGVDPSVGVRPGLFFTHIVMVPGNMGDFKPGSAGGRCRGRQCPPVDGLTLSGGVV